MQTRPNQARRDGPPVIPRQERRQPPGRSARARLRWLRGLVLRPFRLRWQRGPRLVWVERRRGLDPELIRLRADLHAEMLALEDGARVLRELLRVDELLGQAGWPGLAGLPAPMRSRARLQADMLAEASGSAALAGLARRLSALERGERREAGGSGRSAPPETAPLAAVPEVSELGEEAYVQAEQVWANSQLAAPAPPPPGIKT